jgi:hypothetical protein
MSGVSTPLNNAVRATISLKVPWNNNVTGDVTIRVCNHQLEVAATSSTFIPTSGWAVTRAADVYQLP